MSFDVNIKNWVTATATALKATRLLVNGNAADLSALNTTNKTNLVAALNELQAAVVSAASSGGAQINDAAASGTTVYSSQKVIDLVAALKTDILGGATAAYDTLQELKGLLDASDTADDAAIAAINTALGNRVRFDAAQTLTSGQKTQALTNIGAASTADVAIATTTTRGTVEFATTAEGVTGTAADLAMTPAAVRAVTGDPNTDYVALFNAGLA